MVKKMEDKLFRMIINRIQFEEIYKVLSTLKIDYALVKGDVLSWYAYNELGQRKYRDIDILISENSRSKLVSALTTHGFTQLINDRFSQIFLLTCSHQTIPFTKTLSSQFSMKVDVNIDIFWGEYEGKRIEIDDFLKDVVDLEIYGHKYKTLTPIKTMVHLILHNYKDMNSLYLLATRKSIKYNMFKDLFFLLKNNSSQITLDELYSISYKYNILPYVYYVLYYVGQVFNDKLIDLYIYSLKNTEGERLLNSYGLCENERKEWKYDFKTRLETANLYDLIKDDLTKEDKEKIDINKSVFLGH